jgi:hypothetical protein
MSTKLDVTLRPHRASDLSEFVLIANAANEADGIDEHSSEAGLGNWLLTAALVGRSLALLRERGMTSAWLGLDADNPTGALGIYERAGFEVHLGTSAYHKPMEISR